MSLSCQVKLCDDTAKLTITYDCGDGDDQIISICNTHYESHDVIDATGEKFYYFKKFAKNVEVLN